MTFLNSLIARIWGPFMLMGLLLTFTVGFYIPRQQARTLREFQLAELGEVVKVMADNISVAGQYDDWSNLNEIFQGASDRPSLEFAALILESGGMSSLVASNPPNVTEATLEAAKDNPLLVMAPFDGGTFKGQVVVMGSEAFIDSELARLNFPLQIALGLVLLAVTLMYFFLIARVSRPLNAVQKVAELIRQGELKKPVENNSKIRELRSLNLALEGLRSGLLEQRNTNMTLTKGMENEIKRQTKDLRKTLDELQDSRNLFGSVIESALDAMVIANGESLIVEWNRKAEMIFGWSREEAIGQSLTALIIPKVHRHGHNEGMAKYHATGQGPVLNNSFETTAMRRNGEEFDIELYITSVRIGNEEIFSSFIRDITQSKQLAQDLEHQRELNSEVLNGLPLMISLKKRDLKYTFVNNRAQEVLGKSREDMIGRTESEVFETEWVEESAELDQRIWEGENIQPLEYTFRHQNKPRVFLIGRYIITLGSDTPTSYLLTYGFEVSQLKAVQAQLEQALKTKDEFLATISHEIRTPLHSIIVLAELLNQPDRTSEIPDFSANIRSSSRHLLDLVNDILDFSKASAKRLELSPTEVNIGEFIHELKRVDTTEQLKDVTFSKESEGCEGIVVLADRVRLNQVLQNLLSNAFKFTETGEVKLTIKGGLKGTDFNMLWTVTDTGIGISEENQEKVLNAFEQAHSGITRRFGGTGLGLGIVSKLLDLMGSKLEIKSELNKGSTFQFSVSFPVVDTPIQAASNDTRSPHIRGLKMLYVEDMAPNQMVMKAMSRPLGIDLHLASSGMEAIEQCAQGSFDLVLMDIQMPEMDGVETYKALLKHDAFDNNTPTYAFTAHAGGDESSRFMRNGFAGVLTKPLTPHQLETFLNDHLKNEQHHLS